MRHPLLFGDTMEEEREFIIDEELKKLDGDDEEDMDEDEEPDENNIQIEDIDNIDDIPDEDE